MSVLFEWLSGCLTICGASLCHWLDRLSMTQFMAGSLAFTVLVAVLPVRAPNPADDDVPGGWS